MKFLFIILFSFPLSLYPAQDCKKNFYIVNPVASDISVNDITNGLGDDIAVASLSTGLTSINANEITYTPGDDIAVAGFLNLSPIYTQLRGWVCEFTKEINSAHMNSEGITVKYSLSALSGQSGGISNGNFFIPTTVRTKNLYFEKKGQKYKVAVGDIEFEFDLSHPLATSSGNYSGVLTIEVYEN